MKLKIYDAHGSLCVIREALVSIHVIGIFASGQSYILTLPNEEALKDILDIQQKDIGDSTFPSGS